MPVDYYPNKTLEQLVALLERVQGRQTGGQVIQVSAAGVTTVKAIPQGNTRTEVELRRILYSCYRRALGTDSQADWPNPYAQRITRTQASYR